MGMGNKKSLLNILLFGCFVSSGVCLRAQTVGYSIDDILAATDSMNVNIDFYGRIIDQNGSTIPDITVNVGIGYIEGILRENIYQDIVTDGNGYFECHGRGIQLSIPPLEKEGYEYINEWNPERFFLYIKKYKNKEPFVPDKNNPVVFRLRKKGKPEYLLSDYQVRRCIFTRNEPKDCDLYLFRGYYLNEYGKPGLLPDGSQCLEDCEGARRGNEDVMIQGAPLSADEYEFIISPLIKDSGCLLSKELLYEAPSDGYQEKIVFSNQSDFVHNDSKFYIYFKINDGLMYSYMEIKPVLDIEEIRLNYESFTNPSGSRSFEKDIEYYSEEKDWRREIKEMRRKERLSISHDEWERLRPEVKQSFLQKEEEFQQKVKKLRVERKKEHPRWWDKLEKQTEQDDSVRM